MVKTLSSRLLWGIILIIGGLLLLLDTFGVIEGGSLFWTVVSAVAGLLFLSVFISQRDNWWALIPGIIFLAIAATIGLNAFLPGFDNSSFQGTLILGGIGLSFFLVYLADRGNWWAIIPAGVIATIAVVAIPVISDTALAGGGIFFLGLGLTFALVAILPNSVGPMRWAWIPAIILGVFGILLLISAQNLINYIWPILLIIGGGILLVRAFRRSS
jgi:hypothetical protein